MIFKDDETLRMYVEESVEHLADIEKNLLAIEKAGADIDKELVNCVFRAAHSIKGGAGFMGLTNIKELAHKAENILSLIRNKEIVPNSEIINNLLKAFDKLRELINDVVNSNNIDVSEHIVTLTGLTAASLPDGKKETVSKMLDISIPGGKTIFQVSQYDIEYALQDGKLLYLVEYDLIHDIQGKNKSPMEIIISLLDSGVIVESKIDIAAAGMLDSATPTRIPFYILFSSIIGPDIIPSLFEVDEKYVHLLKREDCLPAVPENATEKDQEQTIDSANQSISPVEAQVESEMNTPSDLEPEGEIAHEKLNGEKDVDANIAKAQTSLRVNVELLDKLMTLAGELVLSRNQLIQGISEDNTRILDVSGQRIDIVTSELQETIMRTRMQKIANVFNKFPRVVRDLSREMKKEVNLIIEGKEVELDKTIIETINDPLTHLVRNAVDHGIETPKIRRSLGKDPTGIINLRAFHEAGQVNIEISDDGQGLDGDKLVALAVKKGLINKQQSSVLSEKEKIALVFLPGFSTVKKVTDISGRGVGMDVVKTNLDKLGGLIDIDSVHKKGTTIKIKLPLTLAIVPSQIISAGEGKYAIPQVNLNELLRIPAAQVKDRIERVGDAEVVRLRGNLLPLLDLCSILGIKRSYISSDDGQEYTDRRRSLSDRRSKENPLFYSESEPEKEDVHDPESERLEIMKTLRDDGDRRYHSTSAINIAVVSAGAFKYGLVVDKLYDSEEIVVKPLGRHLKNSDGYAGATIMGDGKVALILDVAGLANMATLTSLEGTDRFGEVTEESIDSLEAEKEKTSLLVFRNGEEEQFSVPLSLVERIEQVNAADIENVGGKKVIQYRGGSLPLYSLDEVAQVQQLPEKEQFEVIVFSVARKEIGLMVTPPVDAVDVAIEVDTSTLKQPGIIGSAIIGDYTTLMIDIFEIVKILNPDWRDAQKSEQTVGEAKATILFAEDSDFFRNQVKGFLEDDGYKVFEAKDGMAAWELLEEHGNKIHIVLTDIEMPRMDGFKLTKKIKKDKRFAHLTVIALTSLASDEDVARGEKAGIDDYQLKLDREKLLKTVDAYLKK